MNNTYWTTHLSVNQQSLEFIIHPVLFYLSNVVRYVIDDVHIQVVWTHLELFSEGLSTEERHGTSVDPSKVGGGGHGFEIILPLLRVDTSTRQLPVVCFDVVSLHCLLHSHQCICNNSIITIIALNIIVKLTTVPQQM